MKFVFKKKQMLSILSVQPKKQQVSFHKRKRSHEKEREESDDDNDNGNGEDRRHVKKQNIKITTFRMDLDQDEHEEQQMESNENTADQINPEIDMDDPKKEKSQYSDDLLYCPPDPIKKEQHLQQTTSTTHPTRSTKDDDDRWKTHIIVDSKSKSKHSRTVVKREKEPKQKEDEREKEKDEKKDQLEKKKSLLISDTGLSSTSHCMLNDPFAHIVLCCMQTKPVDSFLPGQPVRDVKDHMHECFSNRSSQKNFLRKRQEVLVRSNEFREDILSMMERNGKQKYETVGIQSSHLSFTKTTVFPIYFDKTKMKRVTPPKDLYLSKGRMPEEEASLTVDLDYDDIRKLRHCLSQDTLYPQMRPGCWMLKEFARLGMRRHAREEIYDLFQFQIVHTDFILEEIWHAAIQQVNSAREFLYYVYHFAR